MDRLSLALPNFSSTRSSESSHQATEAVIPSRWEKVGFPESEAELYERITSHFQDLSAIYEERKTSGSSGFWYPNDYAKRVSGRAKEKLLREESFTYGIPPKGMVHCRDPRNKERKMIAGYMIDDPKKMKPSAILKEIFEGRELSFLGCKHMFELALYRELVNEWGEAFFDHFFSDPKRPFILADELHYTLLIKFVNVETLEDMGRKGERPLIKGALYCFENHETYERGDNHFFNVLCLDESSPQKFLGMGLSSLGATEDELLEFMGENKISPQMIEESGKGFMNRVVTLNYAVFRQMYDLSTALTTI